MIKVKPKSIIYQNKMTNLVEPYTQKNIDENRNIKICGYSISGRDVLDYLGKNGEAILQTPIVNVLIENIHWFGEFKFAIKVPTDDGYCPAAICLIKKEDIKIKGCHGKYLSSIEKYYIFPEASPIYSSIGNILMSLTIAWIERQNESKQVGEEVVNKRDGNRDIKIRLLLASEHVYKMLKEGDFKHHYIKLDTGAIEPPKDFLHEVIKYRQGIFCPYKAPTGYKFEQLIDDQKFMISYGKVVIRDDDKGDYYPEAYISFENSHSPLIVISEVDKNNFDYDKAYNIAISLSEMLFVDNEWNDIISQIRHNQ